jgi:hypothetical protein
MAAGSESKTAFQREVASRFGLVPNFFPRRLRRLKSSKGYGPSTKAGYLDNPIPSLFKERLFVGAAKRSEKWRIFRGLRDLWRQSPWRAVVLLHYLAAACWNSPSDYFLLAMPSCCLALWCGLDM